MTDVLQGPAVATGAAYGMPAGTADPDLTAVGPGTPGGEALRRYWQPVALSSEVADLPVPVRLLGEDLILFRTSRGRVGLVYPRCIHRGTTLRYGKIEDDGIRCCYHGWLFDTEGHTLHQPCEPGGGRNLERYRQPWYPVQELYGVVFAYLGPPAQIPVLPRYDVLDGVPDGFVRVASNHTLISGGPVIAPYNWVQAYENVVDPWHVYVLHNTLTGSQFNSLLATVPTQTWDYTDYGVRSVNERALPDGHTLRRTSELILPNVWVVPPPTQTEFGPCREIMWQQPIDDTHNRVYMVKIVPAAEAGQWVDRTHAPLFDGGTKSWYDLDDEGHQRFPGDFEAQNGQGPVTLHSEEHLVSSDRGVGLFRRKWRGVIADVAAGRQPMNVVTDPAQAVFRVQAGSRMT